MATARWEFAESQGTWQSYSASASRQIEQAWQARQAALTIRHGTREYKVQLRDPGSNRVLASPWQRNNQTGCRRMIRRTVPPGAGELYLHVQTQENDEGRQRGPLNSTYQVFHQVALTADREGLVPATGVRRVRYHTPGQGFRHDSRSRSEPPFEIRYGPCWGRPHVTVDIELSSGETLSGVFEDNLPCEDRTFAISVGQAEPEVAADATPAALVELNMAAIAEHGSEVARLEQMMAEEEQAVDLRRSRGQFAGNTTVAAPRAVEHHLDPDAVPGYLVCPISCQVLRDPVVCMDGHTYERAFIEKWLVEHETSPMTNLPLPSKQIVPNMAIRQELDALAGRG